MELVERLARQMADHVRRPQSPTQLLVTTHSPYFVDALGPSQVWLLGKDGRGHAQARRTADLPQIAALVSQGIPLGSLWYSHHLDGGLAE